MPWIQLPYVSNAVLINLVYYQLNHLHSRRPLSSIIRQLYDFPSFIPSFLPLLLISLFTATFCQSWVFYFFVDRVIDAWNYLPENITDFNSLSVFKRTIKMIDFTTFLKCDWYFLSVHRRVTSDCSMCALISWVLLDFIVNTYNFYADPHSRWAASFRTISSLLLMQ